MSIFNTLQTAVSGMAAQANKIGTIGDNIANSSTTGYKEAGVEFETLLGNSSTTAYESGGVQSRVRYGVSDQGVITGTSSTTDLAISGNGFFVVKTPGGGTALTRAGAFVPDASGDLINAAGFKLQGYNLQDGSYDANSGIGTLQTVNVSTYTLKSTPTTSGTLDVNLDSRTAVPTGNLPSANTAPATYTDKASITAYDKLGKAVNLDVYMTKTADNSGATPPTNTWEVAIYNAADATTGTVGSPFPYANAALGTQTLTFDGTNGNLVTGSASTISVQIPNGNLISIDASKATQLAAIYAPNSVVANGNSPSTVEKVNIGSDGTVSAVYTNGESAAIFKIPLANVQSPDRMTTVSGNIFEPNSDSGAMTVASAKTGSLGEIDSSSLESSTVDLATELTNLIATQRSYEANSKVLSTGSDMLSTIIQALHS